MATHPTKKVPGGPPPGRPTVYSKKIAESITEGLLGGTSLRDLCKSEKLPAISTIMRWYTDGKPEHKEFREQLDEAFKGYAIVKGLEAVDIVDEHPKVPVGIRTGTDEGGHPEFDIVQQTDSAGVNRNDKRARVRQWVAQKLMRRLFGEKLEVEKTLTVNLGQRMKEAEDRIKGFK